ncbi:hypothetical protein ACTWJ8_05855 [Streptomyces sp. SDT5-1]|uniref:hypothetical protein n=1 Tax=Streptomyces sp. SDT5-1 TaxID=3406418 RepID=UPI003FD4A612
MRARAVRRVGLAVIVVGTVGCGGGKVAGDGGGGAGALGERARRVAEAWDGSKAAAVWRAGYHPVGEETRLPRGGLRDEDQQAYERRNLTARGALPDGGPEDGEVAWAAGGSGARPVVSAREAYEALAGPRAAGTPRLVVEEVAAGRMRIDTTRGPASVPAWVFTLDGYASPLVRAAVEPSPTPRSPIGPAHDLPGRRLDRLLDIADDGRSVTVVAVHGVCDDGPRVRARETRGSVVLTTSVVDREGEQTCTAQGKLERVVVKLRAPLGDRVLLDAVSGGPVPYRGPVPGW